MSLGNGYIGETGGQDREDWRNPDITEKFCTKDTTFARYTKWSLGVHGVRRDMWMDMKWIILETTHAFLGGADDKPQAFKRFLEDNPNHNEIIQQHIENELEELITLDMVRVREV